jgi:hypothetical protein
VVATVIWTGFTTPCRRPTFSTRADAFRARLSPGSGLADHPTRVNGPEQVERVTGIEPA